MSKSDKRFLQFIKQTTLYGVAFSFLYGAHIAQASSLVQNDNKPSVTENITEIGIWATKEEDGVFQIYSCGQNLCGRLIGIQYNTPLPPQSSKGHTQCNFSMLMNFTKKKGDDYWRGKIIDPRDEKSYDAKIWSKKPNELKVRGYLGISLLGETHVWHRFNGAIGPNCRLPSLRENNNRR